MNQTLTISENLYVRLHLGAQALGLSVEQYIERLMVEWERIESELKQREHAVQHIVNLRAQMHAKYGEMPDSVVFIREDRER
jgi:hypothetical protein